ncbi:hypothetical protein TGUWTKB_4320 [Candidatus Tachikawaea gelatinosa]|uniref:Uncharacterized protein n=1 Tax=Candidatus Tachikawaea gelatinosa TaxID=1410383 RepID=A0A090ALX3_9ENTR|nr:hypothetical protein TGUWTKB_4320 [Candidatus Tachikawaea gelatinosa]
MNINVAIYFLIKIYLFFFLSFFSKEKINNQWIKSISQEHLIINPDIFFKNICNKHYNLNIQSYYFLQKKKNRINNYIVFEKNKLFIKNFLKKKLYLN